MKKTPEKKIVLLVEDEQSLQEAAKIKLERGGFTVLTAGTGEEALDILAHTKPAIIWLDLLLPGINGLEVLRRIRASEDMKDLPVIMVSVSAGPENIKEALELRAIDYIAKSDHSLKDLVGRFREIIDKLD